LGCEPAALATESFPSCPSPAAIRCRVRHRGIRRPCGHMAFRISTASQPLEGIVDVTPGPNDRRLAATRCNDGVANTRNLALVLTDRLPCFGGARGGRLGTGTRPGPVFYVPFAPFFDPLIGRPSTPVECYLRLMFLKFRYRLGYESLCAEVSDSITWRRFLPDPARWQGAASHDADEADQPVRGRCGGRAE
jgi:Transposase domain (DUF772)